MGSTLDFTGMGERSASVFQALRNEIDRGVYSVGAMIPPQEALAARFNGTRPRYKRR